jgi:hypothetical protein
MALDLLSQQGQRGEVKHLYRHDLESFMWVLAWVCLRYKDGKLLTSGRPLDEWANKDAETVWEKISFLYKYWDFYRPGIDHHMWSLVDDCFTVLKGQADRRLTIVKKQKRSQLAGQPGLQGSASQTASQMAVEIELADDILLREFTTTAAWVELST